jgi:hypothetical protein
MLSGGQTASEAETPPNTAARPHTAAPLTNTVNDSVFLGAEAGGLRGDGTGDVGISG